MTRRCATVARPRAKRFTGYKLHAAAAAEAPILTAIVLSAGNEHDGHHAGALIDQQPEDRRPERVIGDTAYGNVEVREELEQRRSRCSLRCTAARPRTAAIPKERFTIDLEQ